MSPAAINTKRYSPPGIFFCKVNNGMNRFQSFRSCVSLMLVIAILGMTGPRSAMALPMAMVKMTHLAGTMHEQMQTMDKLSSRYALVQSSQDHGHHAMCGCTAQCGLCGVCHAAMTVGSDSGLNDRFTVPTGPAALNLTESTILLDPPPPRV